MTTGPGGVAEGENMKIEIPMSIIWRVKGISLVEKTESTYTIKMDTSRMLLFFGWLEFSFRVFIIGIKTLWEPIGKGYVYKQVEE